MSEDIKFRKTDNNQTIAIKEGEVVGGAGTSVGPDKLPSFSSYEGNFSSFSKKAKSYVETNLVPVITKLRFPKGMPSDCEKILMTRTSIAELVSKLNNDKILALPFIAQVYREGKYREAADTKHPDIDAIVYTTATIKVSKDKELLVQVQTKRRRGSKEYFHYGIAKADPTKKKAGDSEPYPKPNRQNSDHLFNSGILARDATESNEIYEFVDLEVEEVKKNNRSIAFDSVSVRSVDANGFLHVERSPLTRVQVAPYLGREISGWQAQGLDPERMYHAYRPPEELSSAETIKSINGIPIHLEHHDDAGEPEDKQTRVGTTGTDGAFNAPFLMNSLHIFDQDAINRINDGSMKELSLAYTYIPEFKSGVTDDGEKYDFVQRQIRANHLALVENGRAGPSVKVSDSGKEINMADIENKDAGTEQREVDLAQQIIDLHKVDENGNVVDASDEDKEAAITKILDELKDKGMSDEDLKKMKDTLSDLAYSKATGDEAPDSEMKKGEAEDDDEELDEKMKDPTFKSGFEAGVRYGEKREKDDPKRIDRDHEREGEERYLHEVEDALKSCGLDDAPDEVKDAFKEGYKFTAKEAEDDGEEVEEKVRASDSLKALKSALIDEMTAIEEVKPVVGAIRLGAYDSAGQVYMAALKKLGISGVSASQARIAYRAYIAGRQGSTKSTARDSAPKESRTALTQILEKVN